MSSSGRHVTAWHCKFLAVVLRPTGLEKPGDPEQI